MTLADHLWIEWAWLAYRTSNMKTIAIDFKHCRTRKDYLDVLSGVMDTIPIDRSAAAWLALACELGKLGRADRIRSPRFKDLFQAVFVATLVALNPEQDDLQIAGRPRPLE